MATAKLLSDSRVRQRWLITGASTGNRYHADTYANSDLMHIENAETGRAVPSRPKLTAEIRQAIKETGAAPHD